VPFFVWINAINEQLTNEDVTPKVLWQFERAYARLTGQNYQMDLFKDMGDNV